MVRLITRTSILAVATLTGATGCTSLQVKSDTNTALIHSVQCRTFGFAGSFRDNSPLRGTIANPVNENRLRLAITGHLQGLGMQSATENPDCLVGYGIGSRDVVENAYPAGWAFGGGFGWRHGFVNAWGPGWGWGPGWYGPSVYREGIIGVDLYDAKSKQPLWHATANQNLHDATGEAAEKKINAAVDAIFLKYPK
jgi:hypothetical protein